MKDIKQIPTEHLIYALKILEENALSNLSVSRLLITTGQYNTIKEELNSRPEIQASFKILGLEELL